jgi:hypothetical protein
LARTGQTFARRYAFGSCGSGAYVLQSLTEPTTYRIAGSQCHDRLCVPCSTVRSRQIALNVIEALGNTRARFITLTVKQTRRGLTGALDHLRKSFHVLQKNKEWRSRVKTGCGFVEVKYNADDDDWNVHLHLLVTGKYFPHDVLRKLWYAITGDSYIVDIRLPKGRRKIVQYITKYASKPLNGSFLRSPGALDEAVVALKGRRLCVTFGGWRSVLTVAKPTDSAWEVLDTLACLIERATNGEAYARKIIDALVQQNKLQPLQYPDLTERSPPKSIDSTTETQLAFPGIAHVLYGPRRRERRIASRFPC